MAYKKGGRTKRAQVVEYEDVKNMSTVTPSKSTLKSTRKAQSKKASTKQKRKAPSEEEEKGTHARQPESHRENKEVVESGESSYSRRRKKQRQEETNEETEQPSPAILSPQPHKRTFKYPSLPFNMDKALVEEDLDCKELVMRLMSSICEEEKSGLEANIHMPRGKDYILPFLAQILDEFPALLEDEFPSNLQTKDEVDRDTESSIEGLGEQLQELEAEIDHCRALISSPSSLVPSSFQLPEEEVSSASQEDENADPLHNKTTDYLTQVQSLVSSVKTSAQQMEECQEGIQSLIAEASVRQSELYDASKDVMSMPMPSSSSNVGSKLGKMSSERAAEKNPAKLIAKLSKRKRK